MDNKRSEHIYEQLDLLAAAKLTSTLHLHAPIQQRADRKYIVANEIEVIESKKPHE